MRAFRLGFALAAGAVPIGITPAVAQSRLTSDCGDDRGVDRCSADVHRRVLDLYGLQPIEAHARAGDQVRRVIYVDGYGRDMVAIAFVRAPGRDPAVSVHFPREDGSLPPPLTASVPTNVWAQVLERSVHFDRDLVPLKPQADQGVISMCLHAWVYTVEATEQGPREDDGLRVRRKVQDACANGLAEEYANTLPGFALPLFPACAALDREQHRNVATLLNECRKLGGDRLAAAEAFNLLSRLDDGSEVYGVFGQRATVDWTGERTSGSTQAVVAAWSRGMANPERATLYIGRVTGERADHVRAEGELVRYVDGAGDTRVLMTAPVTFELTDIRDGQGVRVTRATVGAFAERSRD